MRNDLWGDHVVISAIANMFCVTIHVVQSRPSGCTVFVTSSVDNRSCCDIYLALLLQYHFVGLNKQPESLSPDVVTPSLPNNQTTVRTSSHSCSPEQIIEPHSEEIPGSNVYGQPENTTYLSLFVTQVILTLYLPRVLTTTSHNHLIAM